MRLQFQKYNCFICLLLSLTIFSSFAQTPPLSYKHIIIKDSITGKPIPNLPLIINLVKNKSDTVKINGFSDEKGVYRLNLGGQVVVQTTGNLYTNKSQIISESSLVDSLIILLTSENTLLNEVAVQSRILYEDNKIEYWVKKPLAPEAPITRNFIKNLPGVAKTNSEFNYLGKSILYFLDGVKSARSTIEETLVESLEKVEVILSPNVQFWMKPDEIIFNFISKKTKVPKSGLNINPSIGFIQPYYYNYLSYYHIDKKFNFRFASLSYLTENNSFSSLQQALDNQKSISENYNQKKTSINNPTFLFNYFIDSTTTLSYDFVLSNIKFSNQSNQHYTPLFDRTLDFLQASNQTNVVENDIYQEALFKKKNHIISISSNLNTSNREILLKTNDLNSQFIESKINRLNFNYTNSIKLKTGGLISYNLSAENISSTSRFSSTTIPQGQSNFQSIFYGLKLNYQKTIKNLSVVLGSRIDVINQNIETIPISDNVKRKNIILLPTLNLDLKSEKYGNLILTINKDYSIPEISKLAKFYKQTDPFNSFGGNSQLVNEYKTETSLYHYWQNEKISLTTNISHEYISGFLGYGPLVINNSLLQQTYSNIGNTQRIGIHINTAFTLGPKISSQFTVYHSFIKYKLIDELYFNTFNNDWNSYSTFSNSTSFKISNQIESSIDISYTNYDYTFFTKTSYLFPAVSFNLDTMIGKDWYLNLNWNTMFKNATINSEITNQPKFQSTLLTNLNNSNLTLGIRKIFGNKTNRVYKEYNSEKVERTYKKD